MTKLKPIILCVDDEKAILRSLRRSFFDKEVQIEMAGSGAEALDFLSSNSADMVVTDYMMPEMNGLELLKEIRSRYPWILRVILSGYVEKDIILDSLIDFTAVTYFSKPWDEDLLNRRLWDLLKLETSVKNKNLWIQINNGFPVPGETIGAIGDGAQKKPLFAVSNIEELKEFVKRDIFSYIRLLHLANTDYVKGEKIFQLDKLIDIAGYEYLSEYINNCPVYKHNAARVMYYQTDMVLKSFSKLYQSFTGKVKNPEIYDYAVMINIENMILLSVSPNKFYSGIMSGGIETKSFESLVKLIFRLWNIPEKLLNFYLTFRRINIESDEDIKNTPGAVVLKILKDLSILILLNKNTEDVPLWWKWGETLYTGTLNSLKEIRKSQL